MAVADDLFPTPCVYVSDFSGGYRRIASGGRFRYVTARGRPVRSERTRARLDATALPPAYTDCWYCASPRGHIQAIGIDARGRRQYRYHPAFRAEAEDAKFGRLGDFGAALPAIRQAVDTALARRDLSRERVIAAVVRLLDTGCIRIGNRQYARANRSFGATTLRRRHASAERETLRLEFTGKGGKAHSITIGDRRLASLVRRLKDVPGQELFRYRDEAGEWRTVGSADINAWLREVSGGEFTAKYFRTWHASALAFEALADSKGSARLGDVMGLVAERLGNTPAIARKSYVHPALIAILTGERDWQAGKVGVPRGPRRLARAERGLLALLSDNCALH